jgi:membrane protein implicated in regulation of membrane protease activity
MTSYTPVPQGRALLRLIAGLGVWASCFVLLYAGLSLGCSSSLAGRQFAGMSLLSLLLTLIWIAHLAVLAVMLWRAWRDRHAPSPDAQPASTARFTGRLTWVLHGVALVATVVIGFPVLMLPACSA